jgi:hypothetical protein
VASGLANPVRTIGWGVFCASSWTWVIGMFLPIILLERYGWLGFFVFAVPNVLGCAAFGYVIRSRVQSEWMVRTHAGAMAAFSAATIAFHVFFAGFAARCLIPGTGAEPLGVFASLGVALGAFVLMVLVSYAPRVAWLPMAAAAYIVSLIAFTKLGVQPLLDYSWHATEGPRAALWLIPVMLLGFLLCPYLDLTFHRARQLSPSHHAFGVFGVTFALMIMLTCAYAPFAPPGVLPTIVFVHIGVQLLFTSAAHAREIRECDALQSTTRVGLLAAPLLAAPLVMLLIGGDDLDVYTFGKDHVYLRFIVIYGLIAPAYVLLMMMARRLKPPNLKTPDLRSLLAAALVTIAISPCYELGFFHGVTWLLAVPPLVLAAVAVIWRMVGRGL